MDDIDRHFQPTHETSFPHFVYPCEELCKTAIQPIGGVMLNVDEPIFAGPRCPAYPRGGDEENPGESP